MRQIARFATIGTAVALVVTGLTLHGIAHAQTQTIQISNAWARRAPAMSSGMGSMDKMDKSMDKMGSMKMGGGGNGAVYVTLTNPGAVADALVSASSDAAKAVELHEVKHEGGVMKMRPVSNIPVPAHGKTELKPGGYHIMLVGLTRDLKPGEQVSVTLKFERGGEVRVDAPIK